MTDDLNSPGSQQKPTPAHTPFFVPGEKIILTRNGDWLADGMEITHEPTRLLFAKNLKKDAQGYYIQVGYEAKRIQIEDTAYFILRLERQDDGSIILGLNDETRENLNLNTLKYSPGRLTCKVHQNEEARFLHTSYFDLLKDLQEDEKSYYLTFFTQGKKTRIDLSRK